MINFFSWLPARWLVALLALLAAAGPALAQPTVTVTTSIPAEPTVTEHFAPIGGKVALSGGAVVTQVGVEYRVGVSGSQPNPNSYAALPMTLVNGSFSDALSTVGTAYKAGTLYDIRAYAISGGVTTYGNVVSFYSRPTTPQVYASTTSTTGGIPYPSGVGSTLTTGAVLNTRRPTYTVTQGLTAPVSTFTVTGGGVTTVIPTPGSQQGVQPVSAPLSENVVYTVYATITLGLYGTAAFPISSNPAPSTSNTFTIDVTAPTATISSTAGSTTTATRIPFTVTFSEPVTGSNFTNLSGSSVTVANGSVDAGSFQSTGTTSVINGRTYAATYTFTVTPATSGTPTTVSVAASVAQDAVTNGNVAAGPYAITYTAPTAPTVTTNTPVPATVLETSAVLGGDVTSDGGAPVTARGIVFSATNAMPTIGGTATTTYPVGTGTGSFTQLVTNLTPGTTYLFRAYATNSVGTSYGVTVILNTIPNAPTVVNPMNGVVRDAVNMSSYGASSSGATAGTFYVGSTVANATPLVSTTSLGAGFFGATQPTPLADGTYVVYATATRGNSPASSPGPVNTFIIDTTIPTATISSTVGASGSTVYSAAPISFTVTFSEPVAVAGFLASDVTVANGVVNASSFTSGGTTISYFGNPYASTYTFTVTPTTAGTATTVSLAASVAYDRANNGNVAAGPFAITYTAPTAPTVTTSLPVAATILETSATLTGTVTSDGGAPVTVRGILVSASNQTLTLGAAATTAYPVGTGTGSYSQRVTGLTPGTGYYYRAYATNSSGTSYGFVVQFFTVPTAPPVTSPANGAVVRTRTPAYVILGPYASGNSGVSSVTLYAGTTVANAVALPTTSMITGPGSYTITAPQSTPLADGTYVVYAIAAAGYNPLIYSGPTLVNTFTVDADPTTTISSTAGTSGGTTSTTPLPFTVTFSEAVTGFVAGDVTVANGTVNASSFGGSGTTYTFTVTPTTAGTVTTVSIATGVAQDAANNNNVAASPYSLTYAAPATATIWTGAISTDWYTAGNWTAGLPTTTVDATIPSGTVFSPVIASGTATTRSLTLNSGATLTQSDGTLDVRGTWNSNGTFGATGGTVVLGSTTLTSIVGSTRTRFWNLTVDTNGAQVSTSAGTALQRVLMLNGNFATQGNPLTLESNSTGTAMVVNTVGVLTGTVTVQRYIVPDLNPSLGYRHVSSPVGNATVASLATASFAPVVNPGYNTSATPAQVQPFPTVYGYNQSRLATTSNNLATFDKGWYSPGALSDALVVGQGYTVNINANQTWNFVGTATNGAVSLPLARNSGTTAPDAGLQLVGNPYPSPLEWNRVEATDRPGVDGTIYVWASNDPANPYAGNYGFYNNGIGNVSSVLPLGQGFFVRVSQGQTSGTLNLKNSQRATSYTNPTYHRPTAETRPVVQLTLKGASSAVTDDAFVYFENGATTSFEGLYDAEKIANPSGLNISTSLSATQRLCVNGLEPLGTSQKVVPLAVGVPMAGSYTLTAAQLLNLSTVPVYLRDLQTGALIDLAQQPSYQFTVSNASALLTNRFELVFSPQRVLAAAPAALAQQVALYPNPATKLTFVELPASLGSQAVAATLVDALGRVASATVLPAQGAHAHQLSLAGLAPGVYTLRLATSAGTLVKRLTVE